MKKKSLAHLGLLVAAALLWTGCGSDKNTEPTVDVILRGVSPPSANLSVNPPQTQLTYFVFQVRLSDPSMSLVPADSWTIDSYDVSYTLVSDPGRHLTALPEDYTEKTNHKISPGFPSRYPVTIVTAAYMRDNAQGFIGTADTATIKTHVLFRVHRNKDGYAKTLQGNFTLNIGNF